MREILLIVTKMISVKNDFCRHNCGFKDNHALYIQIAQYNSDAAYFMLPVHYA